MDNLNETYEKKILSVLYWKKDKRTSINDLRIIFRKKYPEMSDDFFKKLIEELMLKELIEDPINSNLFYETIGTVELDEKAKEKVSSLPDMKIENFASKIGETKPVAYSNSICLTEKGFLTASNNKNIFFNKIRGFLIKTGIPVILAHLLISILLVP